MKLSFRCDDYMYSYITGKPPKLDAHKHKYYELLYFLEGDASYIVGDRVYKASPGDIFVTAPEEEHCITFSSDAPYCRHFVQISRAFIERCVPPELSGTLMNELCFKHNKIPAELVEEYNLSEYFVRIGKNIESPAINSDYLIRTYLMQMVAVIGAIPPERIAEGVTDTATAAKIKQYINRNITEDISLDDIAKNLFMSKYYMCRTFKNETGITLKEYIDVRRVTAAQELFRRGRGAEEVYLHCGFKTYSTFYRVFKKYAGVSPKEYKNNV